MTEQPEQQKNYWHGLEEADWMMPIRAYVDALPLPEHDIAALHSYLDQAYECGYADCDQANETFAHIRRQIRRSMGLVGAEVTERGDPPPGQFWRERLTELGVDVE